MIWMWYQDNERVLGNILATQNLIFLSTDKKVYAISKETHEAVWSYEASGVMVMGMGHLYILDPRGNLTSINVSSRSSRRGQFKNDAYYTFDYFILDLNY